MSTASGIPVDFRRASFTRSRKGENNYESFRNYDPEHVPQRLRSMYRPGSIRSTSHLYKRAVSCKRLSRCKKKIYYISAEFLIGKLLSNNLINLGIYDEVAEFLKKMANLLQKLNPLSRNHLLEWWSWTSGCMFPGFYCNTWTSWRRYWSELPSWTFQTGF